MSSLAAGAATSSQSARFDGVQLALRLVIVVAGLSAVASIRLAAAEPQPVPDLAIAALVGVAALFPDGHWGLAVVALVAVDWGLAVDDVTTPWVIAAAVTMVAFHSALAVATIAPIGARLAPATLRRWARRTVVVVASAPPCWLAVVVVERLDPGSNQVLVGAALVVVALAAMWSRRGDWRPS